MRLLRTTILALTFLFTAFSLGTTAPAQTPPAPAAPAPAPTEPLTLIEALQRAVAGNLDLRRERVNIEIADASMTVARGQFDFVLNAGVSFQRSTQPSLSSQDIASGASSDLAVNVGVLRNLESGGRVQLSLQTDTVNSNSRLQCGTGLNGAAENCTFYNSSLGLTFNHPLLRGFGVEITQANLRKARIQKDMALLNRQMRAANVLRDVVTAYWELSYATQDLAIRRSAVDLAQEQLRITKAQIDVGRLAPIDQAAVERAIGDRLQDVALSEQNLYFRTLDLRRLLGIAAEAGQPPFAAAEMPSAATRDLDAASELRRALESNPQLRSLKMGLALNAIDVQTARDTLKPRLDLVGTVGSRGRNVNFTETLTQAVGLDELTWSAGLNFQLPVENRTASGQYRTAELGLDQGRIDAGALELTIRDTVLRYASQIHTSTTRVGLAKQTVGFAQQNLEAEKARFSVGRSTNNEVLRLQQELKNAEIAVVRATVDLLDSDVNMSAITAEILDRYGVVLRGM
jgi:outer membrane protein